MNEIHELGLMYLNYEILLHGYKTIYLGESMPIENLKDLKNILVLSFMYRTWQCKPERDVVDSYVQKMSEELLDDTTELWYWSHGWVCKKKNYLKE
jgi:hypothetical protein